MTDSHNAPDERTALTPKRIEALHDGVFAIVMTLLVLEMHIPEVTTHADLNAALWHQVPLFLTYVVTFINLGIYWVGQQIQFHYIDRSDRVFSWIHIFFLMMVSLLPFSSALLGRYADIQMASVIYGINLIVIGIVSWWSWTYATFHHRLSVHTVTDKLRHKVQLRILVAPVAALIAIGLSFYSMNLSLLCYLIILPYYIVPGHIDNVWRQAAVPHEH